MSWSESAYSRDAAMRLARAGALVSIVCAEGACEVCRSREGRVYSPADVPRLPMWGCLNKECRCRFVAVDPETELTVPQMVERGVVALKSGKAALAQQILRRAVALDEMSEAGWLWLGGAVDDSEKVVCLQKVLDINSHNERARMGLEALQKKLGAAQLASVSPPEQPPAPASAPQQPPAETPAAVGLPAKPWPAATVEAREERQVIVEQWHEFLSIAAETDPEMLLMQGNAFLKKLERLNAQALEALPDGERLAEMRLQWNESDALGEALADLLQSPGSAVGSGTGDMHLSLRQLAQKLLAHRQKLRAQIAEAGGQVPS